MADLRAFLSRDRQTVLMIKGRWRQTIRATEAPAWRDFYRRLWSRGAKKPDQPGPYAEFHEQQLRAMEAVCRQIKESP